VKKLFARKFVFIMFVLILLSACKSNENLPVKNEVLSTIAPTLVPTIPLEQKAIWVSWESGPHADTYDLEKGPNTYCAKCHSPTNWDVAAKIDPPPNCVSCKFAFESEPRIAQGNTLVPESEWNDIGCEVCHVVTDGLAESGIGWLNPTTGYHETVANATELCEKCHLDNQTLRHKRDLGENAHADFECVQCHDSHSVKANCRNCHPIVMMDTTAVTLEHPSAKNNDECRSCHPKAWDEHDRDIKLAGDDDCMNCHDELMVEAKQTPASLAHSSVHLAVSCVACHDASGLEVGPIEGQNLWMTFRTTELLGHSQTEPYQSHNLQKKVDCGRCHYPGNPWDIPESIQVSKSQ
jgi:hypothetical protein